MSLFALILRIQNIYFLYTNFLIIASTVIFYVKAKHFFFFFAPCVIKQESLKIKNLEFSSWCRGKVSN